MHEPPLLADRAEDARPDVLLTGLLFYDVVMTGLPKPPAPGQEIWTGEVGSGPGGIANPAVAAARYGLTTSLATVFGDDFYGTYCRNILAGQEGIDLSLSRTAPDWNTPVTFSPAQGHDRSLVTHGQEVPYTQDELMQDMPPARSAIVHIGSAPQEWTAKASAAGTRIFADVGWDPTRQCSTDLLDQLSVCHAFMPNDVEAMACTRTDTRGEALRRLAELVPVAVVTCGRDGALAIDQTTDEFAQVRALDLEVLDATGAGDVFGASFVAATLDGWPLADRLRFAGLAAALSVRHHGGALAAPGWHGIGQWWRTTGSGDPELSRAYGFLEDRIPADPGEPRANTPITVPRP